MLKNLRLVKVNQSVITSIIAASEPLEALAGVGVDVGVASVKAIVHPKLGEIIAVNTVEPWHVLCIDEARLDIFRDMMADS